MAELLDFLPSIGIGTQVGTITGKAADGFTAGGFSSFVLAVTGSNPTLVRLPGNRAQLVMSKEQSMRIQQFLDRQVGLGIKDAAKKPSLDIQMNPVLIPWMLKYMVPALVVVFVGGWLAHSYMGR